MNDFVEMEREPSRNSTDWEEIDSQMTSTFNMLKNLDF